MSLITLSHKKEILKASYSAILKDYLPSVGLLSTSNLLLYFIPLNCSIVSIVVESVHRAHYFDSWFNNLEATLGTSISFTPKKQAVG